jgi:hypothetical protein
VITTYNQQGFLTTMTVPQGWSTMVKSYDQEGFLIMPGGAASAAAATAAPPVGVKNANTGEVKSNAALIRPTVLIVGIASLALVVLL